MGSRIERARAKRALWEGLPDLPPNPALLTAPDGTFQITVEDTGVGIAPEELPKVFDKFFRSNDPRVQEETGTGLGLSLAREVIRIHGGEITVESIVDQGTTFVATIPIR